MEGLNRGNSRNGKRSKTVLTDAAGAVEIEVPRDREGTFAPVIARLRQRRLPVIDTVVLSLSSRGLTSGEISAHFAEVCGASVPRTRSRGSPTRCWRRWRRGGLGRWSGPVRRSSST